MGSVAPFHTLQAVNSHTFRIPPEFLAGRLPLPLLWDYHLDNSPHHPLFVFERSPGRVVTVSWSQGVRAMHRAGRIIRSYLPRSSAIEGTDPPVVAVFVKAKDAPTSWAVITGILRLGATAFLISPRNSAAAAADLLQKSNCRTVLLGDDAAIKDLARQALPLMKVDYELSVINTPSYHKLYLDEGSPFERLPPCQGLDMDNPALIVHSSGSTSFPKLVVSSHRTLIHWSMGPYFGDKDLCGYICGSHSLPLFHNMGLSMSIMLPSSTGQIFVAYSPFGDSMPPTADTVLSTALACKANYIYTVPTFLEEWATDQEKISLLRAFDLIAYAGGPLNTHLGNHLAAHGVRLCCTYGTSECGSATRMIFDGRLEDWEYIRVTRQTDIHWVRHPTQEHLFEAIVLESPYKTLSDANMTISGRRAFATKDFFEKHPKIEGLWRIHGRGDDQIMHSTGEKTNPGPIESIITKHSLISYAVMFGRARLHVGVLIQPSPTANVDSMDSLSVRAFVETIWPIIHEANEFAPKHSRIMKEMVIIATPSKPFLLTAKHTLRRSAIVIEYTDEIEAAYRNIKNSISADIPPPSSWESMNTLAFVRSVVHAVLSRGESVGEGEDLFQSGADSLQAMMIKNAIVNAFRATGMDPTRLRGNFVYKNPTISSLAQFVAHSTGYDDSDSFDPVDLRVKEMEMALAEFTEPFIVNSLDTKMPMPDSDQETVLVTGTTGSLGAQLLAHLVAMPSVVCVYALNRPGGGVKEMRRRQVVALERQGIDGSIADSPKIVYLEAEVTSSGFGLDATVRDDMLSSLTTIIHNAWAVNFNLSFSSFRPLLQGVRNIIEFALSSPLVYPPRVVFISSVSAVGGWKRSSQIPEAIFEDPQVAGENGYGTSKWMAERILSVAQRTTALEPIVVRVGQLCGSTNNGSWNPNEWFPLIVRSAKAVNCLPAINRFISWLPVNMAASAIIDLRHAPEWMECVHVMHPKPVSWMSIVEPLAKTLQVPVVPYSVWLQKLLEAAADPAISNAVPAVHLVDFFVSLGTRSESEGGLTDEAFGADIFAMRNALEASATLGDPALPNLAAIDAERWLAFWEQNGALNV